MKKSAGKQATEDFPPIAFDAPPEPVPFISPSPPPLDLEQHGKRGRKASHRKSPRKVFTVLRPKKAAMRATLRRMGDLIFVSTVDVSQLSKKRATAIAAVRVQQQETLQQCARAIDAARTGLNRGDIRPFFEALDKVGPRLLQEPSINSRVEAWWLAKENNPQLQERLHLIGEVLARVASGRPELPEKQRKLSKRESTRKSKRKLDAARKQAKEMIAQILDEAEKQSTPEIKKDLSKKIQLIEKIASSFIQQARDSDDPTRQKASVLLQRDLDRLPGR